MDMGLSTPKRGVRSAQRHRNSAWHVEGAHETPPLCRVQVAGPEVPPYGGPWDLRIWVAGSHHLILCLPKVRWEWALGRIRVSVIPGEHFNAFFLSGILFIQIPIRPRPRLLPPQLVPPARVSSIQGKLHRLLGV